MTARSHYVPTSVSRSRVQSFGSLENELRVTVVTRPRHTYPTMSDMAILSPTDGRQAMVHRDGIVAF